MSEHGAKHDGHRHRVHLFAQRQPERQLQVRERRDEITKLLGSSTSFSVKV